MKSEFNMYSTNASWRRKYSIIEIDGLYSSPGAAEINWSLCQTQIKKQTKRQERKACR